MLLESFEREVIALQEQTAGDPEIVDDLLTQEMMNLSIKDRNDIQEEIHGVKCLAVEETPELLQAALKQLAYEINENTPDSQKEAYLQSLRMKLNNDELQRRLHAQLHSSQPQFMAMSKSHNTHTTHTNNNNNNDNDTSNNNRSYCYIHDDVEFRLRFLRCELFHVQKSAKRILQFLDLALELFGEFALRRPIRLSDFTKEEMRYLRKGRFQVMPNRDRSGRRVSTIFPEDANALQASSSECPALIKAKIMLYSSWAIGYRDVETQRKGQIILVWYDKAFAIRYTRGGNLRYRWDACKSTRVTAIHLCSPDTPHYRLRRAIAVMRCGNENRPRLRTHLGESVELRYALQGYGIPSEDIPISWTGKLKMKNLMQWMHIRHAVENYDDYYLSSSTSTSTLNELDTTIVECPRPIDVLFRKGNPYTSHTGNIKLRAMIVSKAYHEDDGNNSNSNSNTNKNNNNKHDSVVKRPKQVASEVFRERLEKSRSNAKAADDIGRYLNWDTQKDWWNEMTDGERICSKIEYITREIYKSRRTGNSNSNSSKLKNVNSNSKTTTIITPTNKSQKRSVPVKLQSGTTLFRSQDGSSNNLFGGTFKKPRNGIGVCSGFDSGSGKSDDDEDLISEARTAECFGIRFTPVY